MSTATIASPPRRVCISAALEALTPVSAELAARGFALGGDCEWHLDVDRTNAPTFDESPTVTWDPSRPDGFAWTSDTNTSSAFVIFAADARAAHYAVDALFSFAGAIPRAALDWPRFPVRGVIEGFYQKYFSREERLSTLRLMHLVRENIYMYAPKDDPFAGYRWRDPYPVDAASDLQAAATLASSLNIDFVFGISPTLATNNQDAAHGPASSIRFSNADDIAALIAKLNTVQALGVTHFAIQFDDADGTLFHAEDNVAFTSAALAHANLANQLVAAVGPLLFVGTTYTSGAANWPTYVQAIGAVLDPRVNVMWTGPSTWSTSIAPADLADVNLKLGRQVYIWDNQPTDVVPVTGRDPLLYTATPALMTNADLVGEFQHPIGDFWKIIGPLSRYTWNPTTYVAEADFDAWQPVLSALKACH